MKKMSIYFSIIVFFGIGSVFIYPMERKRKREQYQEMVSLDEIFQFAKSHKKNSIWWSSRHGNIEEVQWWLKNYKKSLSVKDSQGKTPLHWTNNLEIVQLFIGAGAEIDAKDNEGKTPLHWALMQEKKEIIPMLISCGANVNAKDNKGAIPLHWVKDLRVACMLVNAGANIDAKDNAGKTPLHWAAGQGRTEIVELFLKEKSNIDAKDNEGKTPLHWAAGLGRKGVVELFLKEKSDIDVKDNGGKTPLHWTKDSVVAKLLLEALADVNVKDKQGKTPLHWANNIEIVQVLIDAGAEVNAKDNEGITPLHWALDKGNRALVLTFLNIGVDINAINKKGFTPLHFAVILGCPDLVEFLLQNNAKIDLKDREKERTSLHWALRMSRASSEKEGRQLPILVVAKIIRSLIDHGANVGMVDNENKIPLDWLKKMIQGRFLTEYGGDLLYGALYPEKIKYSDIYKDLEKRVGNEDLHWLVDKIDVNIFSVIYAAEKIYQLIKAGADKRAFDRGISVEEKIYRLKISPDEKRLLSDALNGVNINVPGYKLLH